ncbi:virion protein [Suid betaherpesvirus 2]|uniref:Packaging protein UL32 n=1 Tax=Suid betaherpesvirus 2 TaxID=1608255 RepID=U3GQ13_9BETA|nr:virion protein [Suid betaherpesvirus 2]AGT99230.1 virion protein [Suid betaherpesvirus 2]
MDYTGWDSTLHALTNPTLNEILLYSHQSHNYPLEADMEAPEEAPSLEEEVNIAENNVNLEELKHISTVLNIDKRCNLCSIVNICSKRDTNKLWLQDYMLLCYKCNASPRTTISLLIISSEFIYITKKYFPDINLENLFSDKILTVFDFQVHFYINRCFSNTNSEDIILNETVTLNHLEIIRSLILNDETIPYSRSKKFIFKKQKQPAQSNLDDIIAMQNTPTNTDFTHLFFYMWAGTNIFSKIPLTNIAIRKYKEFEKIPTYRTAIDKSLGPFLLSPVPVSLAQNGTTTVCLLCEYMCTSEHNLLFVEHILEKIKTYCENNIKAIDRIQFVLANMLENTCLNRLKQTDFSSVILKKTMYKNGPTDINVFRYLLLRQVGHVGIYKHFFCDPLCAANTRAILPRALFYTFRADALKDMKVTICHLNDFSTKVHKELWLSIQIYKAFQVVKKTFKVKTILHEFIKDFIPFMQFYNFVLVDPSFTIQQYV